MSVKNAMLASAAAMFLFGIAFAQQPATPETKAQPAPAPETKAQPAPAPETKAAEPTATKTATPGVERVCVADATKFCKDVRPGGGRVFTCLTGHDAELAPACRERLAAGKARLDEFVKACKRDADTHCKELAPGSGAPCCCASRATRRI